MSHDGFSKSCKVLTFFLLWFCFLFVWLFFCQETASASPVILRVDPKGFYLYWTYQSKVSAKTSQLGLQITSSSLRGIKTP